MSSDITIDELDESQITGEGGQVYLFQWLSSLANSIKHATPELIKTIQPALEAPLLKIISSPESYPLPGRGLRNLVARCLVLLYTRGESRSLFDTLQLFMKIAGDSKSADRDLVRVAAFYCIGELMAAFGSNVMSFMAEIATLSLRAFRSSNSSHVRYHAFIALQKTLTTARKALTDALTKDIMKQAKSGLTDKALPVQRAAARVLIAIYSSDGTITIGDVESVIQLCVKSLEGADSVTRSSLSQLVAHVLVSTQAERVVTVPEQHAKAQKDNMDADDSSAPAHAAFQTHKPLLSPEEMLTHLSTHFNKVQTSRRTRAGIFEFYLALLNKLGPPFAEGNYALIVSHLVNDILCHPRVSATRYDKLFVRKLVGIVMRDLIAVRMLSEQGQISAIQELSMSYLKRWPALMTGQVAPSSLVLVTILKEVAAMLQQLGNAPPLVQEAVTEPLVMLLTHPSHTVRVNAAWTLRCFCSSTPLRLPKVMLTLSESLHHDTETLLSPVAPSDIHFRTLGHAYGLAALVAIIPQRPLYVSYDVTAQVLDLATQLLKRAGDQELRVAGVEVEVAWTLIASLTSLGPNFVRPHLPQLLVLWRNALPKPTNKDNTTGRSVAEWEFLLHVRSSALGAILCFLHYNSPLLTLDVARRLSSSLNNALSFSNIFSSQGMDEPQDFPTQNGAMGLTLRSREAVLRCRVFQCFSALGFSSITDSVQLALLQSVVSAFLRPSGVNNSTVQAAIASSSGSSASVWQAQDGYAHGLTTTDISEKGPVGPARNIQSANFHGSHEDILENAVSLLLDKPVLGGLEHDTLSLCFNESLIRSQGRLESPPPGTAVVDAAIDLFSQLLPMQDISSTVTVIEQLATLLQANRLEKNVGRKTAVFLNAMIALAKAFHVANSSHSRQSRETLGNNQVTAILSPFLKDGLTDNDDVVRSVSSEVLGCLANIAGTTFLTGQIKILVDQIVNNRDPQGRAGCALAFGAIYSHVGGLAAGPLLKTTVNVLMSLSSDPHPLVHFWSLHSLARVINSASLAYSPHISSTLGMLLNIYMLKSHEAEGGTLASGDLSAYPVLCQIIDAVITVLGPDIQESRRTRSLILNLVHELMLEDEDSICIGAIQCIQHFLMFGSEYVEIPQLVATFRSHLASSRRSLKLASIDAIYQLVQKDALAMSKLGGDQLVEDLFGMLDTDSSMEGVRKVISSWLSQTAVYNPSAWIDLCQRIMLRTTASQEVANPSNSLIDDEGESLSNAAVGDLHQKITQKTSALSRWRTQQFALTCLHDICIAVSQSDRREHIDEAFARSHGFAVQTLLVSRVSDLIKMAFTASAAYVTEIRMQGLVLLQNVIEIFAKAPDPDYPELLLLEQYQAPITAALTPAFSNDSSPDILATAIQVCSVFVGSGIVKDINRLGRILKVLTSALNQINGSGNLSLGNSVDLSPNGSAMLRLSILSAWAQIEVASQNHSYLVDIIGQYRPVLASLWIASLRDFAMIKADSEFIHDTSSPPVDPSYSNLGKEVLLPYYSESWSVFLEAITCAMERHDAHMIAAIRGEELSSNIPTRSVTPSTDHSPFFFVIFGLVYEALATSSSDSSPPLQVHSSGIKAALRALKCLVDPQYSGQTLLDAAIFKELVSLCYRIAMTEQAAILIHLAEVMVALAALPGEMPGDSRSFRPHSLKISAYMIRHTHPSTGSTTIQGEYADKVKMVTASLSVFRAVALLSHGKTREDIRGLACLMYSEFLKDEFLDEDYASHTLPSLQSLLAIPISDLEQHTRLVHGLLSSCLLNIDEMRGRHGKVSSRKIKNNLLASVLVLTVTPSNVKIARGVLEHCAFLITQRLQNDDEMAFVAAHCAKMITSAAADNSILRRCAKLLLPGLAHYVARGAAVNDNGLVLEWYPAVVEEVWKTFLAVFALVTEEQRSRVLGLVLPMAASLLRPPYTSLPQLHSYNVSQILSLATLSPQSFKEAAGRLESTDRAILEQMIRRVVSDTVPGQLTAKPQISLRSF